MSKPEYEDHLENVFGGLTESRFKFLFFVLFGIFFVVPLFGEVLIQPFPIIAKLIYLFLFFIVLAGVSSVASHNRVVYRLTIGLSLLALLMYAGYLGSGLEALLLTHHVLMTAILGYFVISLVRYLFVRKTVTLNTLYAGLCSFLLIALGFALCYSVIDIIQPDSFSVPMEMATDGKAGAIGSVSSFHSFYFSIVTITTLGYGDITPLTGAARMLAGAEAFIGQMFIAVMIARLVGIYTSQGINAEKE